MKAARVRAIWLWGMILTTAFDSLTTYALLELNQVEHNPILNYLFSVFGIPITLFFVAPAIRVPFIAAVGSALYSRKIPEKDKKFAYVSGYIILYGNTPVVFWNFYNLIQAI